MKEIGGYFELELNQGSEYHFDAVRLNSARNALQLLLMSDNVSRVYLPAYCCNSIIEPLLALNIPFQFYHISNKFEIQELPDISGNERLLYINYFGLKSSYIKEKLLPLGKMLIVDNSQAFFEKPLSNIDTFYSPRKFFGVPDGAYLYSNSVSQPSDADESIERIVYLMGRIEAGANAYYPQFQQAELQLNQRPVKAMSKITSKILKNIDYQSVAKKRQENFAQLHQQLAVLNNIAIFSDKERIPMTYPLLLPSTSELRKKLLAEKIYTPSYWLDAVTRTTKQEQHLIYNLIPLPIDQRYSAKDMDRILEVVLNK